MALSSWGSVPNLKGEFRQPERFFVHHYSYVLRTSIDKKPSHLQITPLGPSNQILELVFHVGDDRRLDGDQQVPLTLTILQHDSEGIVNLTVRPTIGPKESSYSLWPAEKRQGLVNRVRSCITLLSSRYTNSEKPVNRFSDIMLPLTQSK